MKRKLFALCIALCLCVSAAAIAEAPANAGACCDIAPLKVYATLQQDAAGGEWTLDDPLYASVIDSVTAGEVTAAARTGLAVFELRLSGNTDTGTLRPEMVVRLFRQKPVGVCAVTFIVNEKAYVFAASAVHEQVGSSACETMVLPLDSEELLELPRAIAAAESVEILIHGTSDVYQNTVARSKGTTAAAKLGNTSIECVQLLTALDLLDVSSYALWDVSAQEWEYSGITVENSVSSAKNASYITIGDKGNDVKDLQKQLASAGFYAGAQETTFGSKTAAAVSRAQQWYGLIVTGSADKTLLNCLKDGTPAAESAKEEMTAPVDTLGSLKTCVDRFYTVRTVRVAGGDIGMNAITCSDDSNVLFVCEGTVRNEGAEEVTLGWQLTAQLVINSNAKFDCTVRCKNAAGTALNVSVLPLAEGTLVAAAEIPQSALESANEIVLVLTGEGSTLEYKLK